MKTLKPLLLATSLGIGIASGIARPDEPNPVASKPLFRDPVYDGAADPVVIWNRAEQKWFMLYTNRRANVRNLKGVAWVHGTKIGIAESSDGGLTWQYRGVAQIALGGDDDSLWAPDVVYQQGTYHMFLSFVPGMHEDWSGTREMHHLTSTDLLNWTDAGKLNLSSDRVIDASLFQMPNGNWRLWYNDEKDHKSIHLTESSHLLNWTDKGKIIGDKAAEGPKIFRWKGYYWMVVDQWKGLGVYRSADCDSWEPQPQNILAQSGTGVDDGVKGDHADVVVSGDRAFLFYFTQFGRRSSIQVTELELKDNWLACDRNKPVPIKLLPPE
ncbi:hypothetical protein IAD21_05402 [Abditibacteriota bacterium]|nr:hypothetical protein IAD21_05402 [Abditibacteriota bacterium]